MVTGCKGHLLYVEEFGLFPVAMWKPLEVFSRKGNLIMLGGIILDGLKKKKIASLKKG